jgi:CRISPR/Cas system-associated exonuclease Cas4 (RecB family)
MPFEDIQERIWHSYYDREYPSRNYIGASILGHDCDRRIWFELQDNINPKRYLDPFAFGRQQITFERGHKEEEIFIAKLRNAGYEITNQQESFSDFEGKFKGHCDGIIYDKNNVPYILEIKTMKERYFRQVLKYGLKKSYYSYISQIQLYMHYFKIDRALIICINKNNDNEIHNIVIEYEPLIAEGLISKLKRILSYEAQMPPKIDEGVKPFSTCYNCSYRFFCHVASNIGDVSNA